MNMIGKIHGIVWGPWTPVLFLMVGFVYSVRIRFFQIRKIPDWWNATIGIFCMTGVSTGDHSGRRVRRWRPRSGPGISQESRRL